MRNKKAEEIIYELTDELNKILSSSFSFYVINSIDTDKIVRFFIKNNYNPKLLLKILKDCTYIFQDKFNKIKNNLMQQYDVAKFLDPIYLSKNIKYLDETKKKELFDIIDKKITRIITTTIISIIDQKYNKLEELYLKELTTVYSNIIKRYKHQTLLNCM